MKVAELTGADLDYWVARAEWGDWQGWKSEEQFLANAAKFHPSTDWKDGGPIIEREKINTSFCDEDWFAQLAGTGPRDDSPNYLSAGRTPLVAAMRCYVASKFGEEVPDETV